MLEDLLRKGLFEALEQYGVFEEDVEIELGKPRERNHGDLSTNLALILGGRLGRKSNAGFFEYDEKELINESINKLISEGYQQDFESRSLDRTPDAGTFDARRATCETTAIAIEQKVKTRNPRSTVGTSTELYEYIKLLFARIGKRAEFSSFAS